MKKIALFISVIGHPLLLGSAYVIIMAYYQLPNTTAQTLSAMVLGLVTIPIIFHNLIKLKKGYYSNFDVSDQNQRKGFYPFALALFSLLLLCFLIWGFPKAVILQTTNFSVMLLLMTFINKKIKASLHVAISFYITLSVFSISNYWGFSSLILAFLISWSREILNRQQWNEIGIGAAVGIAFGIISLLI